MKIDWIRIYQVSRFQATTSGSVGNVPYIFLIRFLGTRMVLMSGAILMATQQLPTFRSTYDLNLGVYYLTLNLSRRHIDAYSNPNITSWIGSPETGGFNQPWPKNELVDQC